MSGVPEQTFIFLVHQLLLRKHPIKKMIEGAEMRKSA